MSRDIVDSWSGCADRLVVLGWVEDEVSELGAVEAEDADVAAGDEHDHPPVAVGGADGDVVEPGVVAEGDGAVGADAVVADAVAGSR